MTKKPKRITRAALTASLGLGSLYIEIRKSRLGASLLLSGVLALDEISDTLITVLSHSGRVFLHGERLSASALEGRTLTVYGKITGVELGYAKP